MYGRPKPFHVVVDESKVKTRNRRLSGRLFACGASPVEIHVVFLRYNALKQYTSSFPKAIRIDATFHFTCVQSKNNSLEFCTHSPRHIKNNDYQNGLADILCKALQFERIIRNSKYEVYLNF